ncbi:expressed unknown protein [Ectocarpus siliculosus]|uniref:Uncharacterized protein n=1 Tax=Ectocarpus siliculosus TaxID=2880 RepID=D7G4S5_ECTSI|nr:expressed unknown protein [Ectocarpus siliculosus]|eukprot:CBJ27168.1 expressed unknown protein [Ectocarpus siliculosus]
MPLADLNKRADLSKYDESVAKDMPEYPGLALTSHVLLKNVQLWSTVGSVASLGVWLNSPDRSVSSLVLKQWPRFAGLGGGAGVIMTVPMMCFKMQTVDLDGLEDRTYRIALNKGVQTVDFYGAIGGVMSLVLGLSTRRIGGGQAKAGIARVVSPWSLMAQGIAAGSVGFVLGKAVGLPMERPLELLNARGFEADRDVGGVERK